jgi:hypothetical protein
VAGVVRLRAGNMPPRGLAEWFTRYLSHVLALIERGDTSSKFAERSLPRG